MEKPEKTTKGQAISEFMTSYVAPLMAVVGWLLLIVFYLMAMVCNDDGGNGSPIIHEIQVTPKTVQTGQTVSVKAFASDPDGDEIHYIWGSVLGRIQLDRFRDDQCTYIAPDLPGADVITMKAYDKDGSDNGFEIITIVEGAEE